MIAAIYARRSTEQNGVNMSHDLDQGRPVAWRGKAPLSTLADRLKSESKVEPWRAVP